MKILAVYDKKAMSYAPAFCVPTMVTATRELDRIINSGKGDYADYPDDFSLYHLADYNEVTGEIKAMFPPILIHELKEFVKPNN